MADVIRLEATVRTDFGKGFARRSRMAGKVPAVVYGPNLAPVHVELPGHEVFMIVKNNRQATLSIAFDGKEQLAVIKDVQRHPVRRDILHVDLVAVEG
ncbi:ribosomal L25p family protein [Gleimia coleocanis DSM 15436]|uniref:Ribosomal L25p family protein n=1 Tax=Gleimia coleocanis DSM 15436 TaxID=525245 RepID=C0W0Z7_9ACTO|nr:50S ribosomal protein L25 [Gleimia coleocanis]EEH63721.1 ribosomal L25p family protein [Gleimia coleocanis DSM 15436]